MDRIYPWMQSSVKDKPNEGLSRQNGEKMMRIKKRIKSITNDSSIFAIAAQHTLKINASSQTSNQIT